MSKEIALITGSSSGFGLLTALSLAKEGYQVIATMRALEKKTALEKAIEKEKLTSIEILPLDVTDHDSISTTIQSVLERYGQIDLLINNAGYAANGYVEDLSLTTFREQFETNFFGLIAVTQAVLPSMRQRQQGRIINMSSVSGRIAFPALSPYSSSKYAVEGFSESLRLEMLPYGVYVSLIEPGSYQTSIWDKSFAQTDQGKRNSNYPKEMEMIMNEAIQIKQHAADPQDVADLIVRVAQHPNPKLRYPIGKEAKSTLRLKSLLPWAWIERYVIKKYLKM
ncbi:SDR family oxidoreductase [Mechercharimyces sp. CAU 1602]|uniref:SDR family oxidoreductase n=1 Tax=Mechercharimyces sp. CAU 1602 TaxID=2973933 RepID=UPI002163D04F|nr:SDR family oxidoreductase [Mechercharimyces sp. CAU 1602]MCS1351448.1 SDR family oxidoreductase [Mechercharimyces sp. CAU 1602]